MRRRPDIYWRLASEKNADRAVVAVRRPVGTPSMIRISVTWSISKVTLSLFELHRTVLVVIDDAQLPLGLARGDELLDDLRHRISVGSNRAGARRAAERPHSALQRLGSLAGHRDDKRLLLDDQGGAAHDHLAFFGEIERDDRDLLDVDVLPDVNLGPVREREDANALAGPQLAVEQAPKLR